MGGTPHDLREARGAEKTRGTLPHSLKGGAAPLRRAGTPMHCACLLVYLRRRWNKAPRYIITYRAQTNEPGPGVLVNVLSHRGSRARGGWGVGLVRMSCHEGPWYPDTLLHTARRPMSLDPAY